MFAAMKSGTTWTPPPEATVPDQKPSREQRDNSAGGQRRRPQVKVFNIPEGTEQDDLKTLFSSVGDVKFVKILPVRDGKTTSLGFIEFETDAEIQKAVEEINNQDFNGQQLRVVSNIRDDGSSTGGDSRSSQPSKSSSNQGGQHQRPQVKVFNIPDGSDQEELKLLFSQAGEVKHMKILPCRQGKDVTLGFIQFDTEDAMKNAVLQFNDYEFNGSNLRVISCEQNTASGDTRNNNFIPTTQRNGNLMGPSRTSPGRLTPTEQRSSRPMGRGAHLLANVASLTQQKRRPQAKVFGIPEGTSQDEVIDLFSSVGSVKFVKLLPIREGKDSHLCFVEFETEDEVNKAVKTLNNQDFNGSSIRVMSGSNQNNSSQLQDGCRNTQWQSNAPTGRIPNEQRSDFNGHNSEIMVPDFQSNACRRCGETGHWARECVNAPITDGSMAITYIPEPEPENEEGIFQQGIHEGINFEKYENIPVELTGNNATKPVSTFEQANMHQVCTQNIQRAQYTKPTPVQKYALPVVLARRDLMACAQTGSGKTASFLLPVISNILVDGIPQMNHCEEGTVYPLAAILAPTRELAVQIFKEARKFSYGSPAKVVVIYGGVSVQHQSNRLRYGCHILVATPGRLDDFIKRGKVSFRDLQYMIFDEADRMLDMGFGPQINQIINNSEMPPKTQRNTLMFSATFPDDIQHMASEFLNDYLFLTVGQVGGTCSDVQQTIIQVPGSEKRNTLEKMLQESGTDRTLVFVERKRDADFLASFLSQRNYPATSLNADRTQQERELALKDFREGVAPVLVATAVAGRGLDINDVKHVINYDLPNDATEYVHRIGRTGRIGNKGKATAFFDVNRDEKLARGLVKLLSDVEQTVPDWLETYALSAVGTGYGPDGGQFRDRRERYQRGGSSRGRFSGDTNNNTSSFNSTHNPVVVPVDDDDEEEW